MILLHKLLPATFLLSKCPVTTASYNAESSFLPFFFSFSLLLLNFWERHWLVRVILHSYFLAVSARKPLADSTCPCPYFQSNLQICPLPASFLLLLLFPDRDHSIPTLPTWITTFASKLHLSLQSCFSPFYSPNVNQNHL